MKKIFTLLFLVLTLGAGAACGVKGPPLPPVADTPQASDRLAEPRLPAPSPLPSPTGKKKGKRTGN